MTGISPAVVSASKLGLTFQTNDGPVQALSNVDLDIGKGEFVSFIGPSGCGKTTLLRVIADLEQPTSGDDLGQRHDAGASAREARLWLCLPGAGALSVAHDREAMSRCRWRSWAIAKAEQASADRAHARPRQPVRLREEISLAALRRHAAARLDRPRAGLRRRPAADGRAVRRARRDRARPSQRTAAETLGADQQDDLLRHALDPGSGLPLDQIVVMSPRPGRVTDIIDSTLPKDRPLDIRETPEFLAIAHRVRDGLRAGHSYED